MLIQIRERASGIVAYIIVILISIPFALWGIHEYFGGPSDRNVAEINGAEITKRIFDNQLQQQRRRLKSLLGDSYEAMYADESQLKKSVLDNLIENTLLVDETRSAGYHISNTQLFERIKSVPQFQIDGQFSNQRYEQLLSSQRRNKVEFEEQLREEERISQYQSSITYSSFLPGNDKTNLAILKRQKRSFDYFIVYELFDLADITQDEITTYYNENTDNFKSPAQVKLEYIELKQQEIGDSLEFSEDELLVSYEDEPDRYRTPELRKAKHILFKLDENSPAEDVEAAFARANKLVGHIGHLKKF